MSTWGHLSLALPAQTAALPTIRRALGRWLLRAGVDKATSADIVAAVWEVCANAAEHPVDRRSDEIVVEADARPAVVCVSVRDSGHWHEHPADTSRGFGLTMVNGLMDEVVIERGPGGTEVKMTRSLRRSDGSGRPTRRTANAPPAPRAPEPDR